MKTALVSATGVARRLFFGVLGLVLAVGALPAIAAEGDAGPKAYKTHCASCHGDEFAGTGFGPTLNGKAFHDKWAAIPADALLNYIAAQMPPGNPGSLPRETYAAVTKFVAEANALPTSPSAAKADAGNDASLEGRAAVPNRALVFAPPPVDRPKGGASDKYTQAVLDARKTLIGKVSPVSDKMLRKPADADWVMWRRTLDTTGDSPLTQIDRSNVNRLTLAWSLSLSPGMNGIAPLVHDGVMFVNVSGTVMAMNATNGDLLWEYAGNTGITTREPHSQPRAISLYRDKVYLSTLDGHVIALDMHTGKVVWDHGPLFKPEDRLALTTGPLVVRGKVIQGVSGCQGGTYRGGCFIVGLDASTGREKWRFHTIARSNESGGDSWNGADVDDRYGGSVWTIGSYDPGLNLVYFGTAQTYKVSTLLLPNKRSGDSSDALYTDSTLALDPDTGKLAWYYQHVPGDVWDLDWAFEQTLVTLDGPDGPRRVVVTGGKIALFDALDAKTGQYLFSIDSGVQNVVKSIDPKTGHKEINPDVKLGGDHPSTVCPFVGGARNWPSTSYDPGTGFLYVPVVENCMDMTFLPKGVPGRGVDWSWQMKLKERSDSDGKFGHVTALNLRKPGIAWTNRRRAPPVSAMLATAGGVVFEGSNDRAFRALDSSTGDTLWETLLSEIPSSFPITYAVGGTQYVALIAGGGTPFDILYRGMTPELPKATAARTIFVFKLGGTPAP